MHHYNVNMHEREREREREREFLFNIMLYSVANVPLFAMQQMVPQVLTHV